MTAADAKFGAFDVSGYAEERQVPKAEAAVEYFRREVEATVQAVKNVEAKRKRLVAELETQVRNAKADARAAEARLAAAEGVLDGLV